MEVRNMWVLPLNVYTDEVLKLSYLRVLSDSRFETVKLPTHLSQYRYQHLLVPTNMLYIELIKTKKNWILKNILQTDQVMNAESYLDFLKLADISKLINNYFQEDMENTLLQTLLKYFNTLNNIHEINLQDLEEKINICLGFK